MDRDTLREIDFQLSTLEQKFASNDDLSAVSNCILARAEKQRSDIGGAYGLANRLRRASKALIKALKQDHRESIETYRAISQRLWTMLKAQDLPLDQGWMQDSETSGELVEAEGVLAIRDLIFGNLPTSKTELSGACREVLKLLWHQLGDPDTDQNLKSIVEAERKMVLEGTLDPTKKIHLLTTNYQAWLAGIGDIPGEIGKLVNNAIIADELEEGPEMSRAEAINLYRRFIFIAQTIHDFLDDFETCYGLAIDNSRRRGFWNTYRGLVFRIGKLIENVKHELRLMKIPELK